MSSIHGKEELLQAIQVLVPQFRLYGTFKLNNVNAGGSAICIHEDLLPDGAMVTYVVTCQGRDHTVNIHLEPDLALRNLRERPRLITPHWPLYSEALGVITEDDFCRGIISYTSYSRTNDYVKLWLRHCVQLYAQQHHA